MENAYCVSSSQTQGSFQKSGWEECVRASDSGQMQGICLLAESMNAQQLLQQHSQDLWNLKPEQIPVWELSMQSHS